MASHSQQVIIVCLCYWAGSNTFSSQLHGHTCQLEDNPPQENLMIYQQDSARLLSNVTSPEESNIIRFCASSHPNSECNHKAALWSTFFFKYFLSLISQHQSASLRSFHHCIVLSVYHRKPFSSLSISYPFFIPLCSTFTGFLLLQIHLLSMRPPF